MSDLFDLKINSEPLSSRMRPRDLNEYVGQDHILSSGCLLRRAIEIDQISSLIFYGPPGTGKTTLARVIALSTKRNFSSLNAVLSGVKELREEMEKAKKELTYYNKQTILFIDEVHHFNKKQQDALLPYVENGTIIFIGATTENPFFEVNKALVSRSLVFSLKPLNDNDLHKIAINALNDKNRGLGTKNIKFEKDALDHIIKISSGDARRLLNAIELSVLTTKENKDNLILITKEIAEQSIQAKAVLYDKDGDYHFDIISAFIKSIRGSDPDAALYWLSKMVVGGEDPHFIFRRLLISSAEDIGLSDPNAITIVNSCANAFDRIGLPEGQFFLAQATLYLATTSKSNSTMAYFDALKTVQQTSDNSIPDHLKDGSRTKDSLGHGHNYLYPHAYEDHFVAQKYLPESLDGQIFYHPSNTGYEKTINNKIKFYREAQIEAMYDNSFKSKENIEREKWINRTLGDKALKMIKLREIINNNHSYEQGDKTILFNSKSGLLILDAWKQTPLGHSVAIVKNKKEEDYINYYCSSLDSLNKIEVLFDYTKDYKFNHIISNRDINSEKELIDFIKLIKSIKEKRSTISIIIDDKENSTHLSSFIKDNDKLKEIENSYKVLTKNFVLKQLDLLKTKINIDSISFNQVITFKEDKLKELLDTDRKSVV